MTKPSSMDFRLLGDAGLGLAEDAYVQAIAGAGVLWISSSLGWSPHKFQISRNEVSRSDRPLDLLAQYRAEWADHLKDSTDRRLIVADEFRADTPDLIDILGILNHSAAGLASVSVARSAPHADLRWQWPLRIASFSSDEESLGLQGLRKLWPARELAVEMALSHEHARCEVLIVLGGIREALLRILQLPYRVRAGHVLLLCPLDATWRDLTGHVDALLAETQAIGLSMIELPRTESAHPRINNLVTALSHNTPFDMALALAFPRGSSVHVVDHNFVGGTALTTLAQQLGRRMQRLPVRARLTLPSGAMNRVNIQWTGARPAAELGMALEASAGAIPFDQESTGAMGLKEMAVAERIARREAARGESQRFLQGDVFWLTEGRLVPELRGLIVGQRYQLEVLIGPPGEGRLAAETAFPDNQLDWREQDAYTIQLLFAEPSQWDEPMPGTLQLPREGTSNRCKFVFVPTRPGPFAGRITVYYRGRVLQTAVLQTQVVTSGARLSGLDPGNLLRFAPEAQIRRSLGTLEDRRRFDAWLVLNHTATGRRTLTAAGKRGAFIASLDGIDAQLTEINRLLNQVALNTKRYSTGLKSKANAELLGDLAREGNILHRRLVVDYMRTSSVARDLEDAEYLQIVSMTPDKLVPLEFVYKYKPPKEGVPVCGNAPQALDTGRCPASCVPTTSPAPHVCPLGFWGMSKVIERHKHDSGLEKVAAILSEPIEGRDVLSLAGPSLVAASKEVKDAERKALRKRVGLAWDGAVEEVKTWSAWQSAVKKKKPVVLLALPHAAGKGRNISLEISGDVQKSIFIDESYVKGNPTRPPLVLLLGCDTAKVSTTEAYFRYISVFRQAEAALVLGTIATVLGTDAATVAARLVEQLAGVAREKPRRFGEVLRRVKCKAVSDSLMMALCLVAFGDADWRLE